MSRLLAVLVSLAAVFVCAAPAHAAMVAYEGDTLVVTGGDGTDVVMLSPTEDGTSRVRIDYDETGAPAPADRCETLSAGIASCAKPASVRVDGLGGNDRLTVFHDLGLTGPIVLDGGDGDDALQGAEGADTLRGGPGKDDLRAYAGDDALDGGDGDDAVNGGDGRDTVLGGPGADQVSGGDRDTQYADVVDGGPGIDEQVSDWYPLSTSDETLINLTLGGGADDGRNAGAEGDDVRGVEIVQINRPGTYTGTDGPERIVVRQITTSATISGGGGDDVLKSGDGADRVDGGAGADELDGGFGDDVVIGGPGRDRISADTAGGDCGIYYCKYPYGNDTVEARDGEVDSIDCGAGTDVVHADVADVVAPNCETVDRGAVAPAGPPPAAGPKPGGSSARVTAKVAVASTRIGDARRGGLRLKVTVSGPGRVAATVRRGKVVVGTVSGKAKKAGTLVLRAKPTRAARTLRARTKLAVTVVYTPATGAAVTAKASRTLR